MRRRLWIADASSTAAVCAVRHAADGSNEPVWQDIVRFLISVPSRRNEATRLDWSHLDMAAAEMAAA
jgi:hypothetical protein